MNKGKLFTNGNKAKQLMVII